MTFMSVHCRVSWSEPCAGNGAETYTVSESNQLLTVDLCYTNQSTGEIYKFRWQNGISLQIDRPVFIVSLDTALWSSCKLPLTVSTVLIHSLAVHALGK